MKSILVVDDNDDIRNGLAKALANAGYLAEQADCGKNAIKMARQRRYDVALVDLVMPDMSGIDVIDDLKRYTPQTKVIMVTAFSTVGSVVEAIKKGAMDYVLKPFRVDELLNIIKRIIEESKVEEYISNVEYDHILSSIANPLRRSVLKMVHSKGKTRFMEILKELGMEDDHQKMVFHLRVLRNSGLMEQDEDKSYMLSRDGIKAVECLAMFEKHLFTPDKK
jgi:DNA-binding response OmpR family regulator